MIKRQNTTLERALRAVSLCAALRCLSLAHSGVVCAQGLDEPLRALRLLMAPHGGEVSSLELKALEASWEHKKDRSSVITLKGEVRLTRSLSAQEAHSASAPSPKALTLSCDAATLHLSASQSAAPRAVNTIRSLTLKGSVRLQGAGLRLRAQRASWDAQRGLITLEGQVRGAWREQRLQAAKVMFWPQEGRLSIEQLSALLVLEPPTPLDRVSERFER